MTTDVTDEMLGRLSKKHHELYRRVREGSLDPEMVLDGLQWLIEGGFRSKPKPFLFEQSDEQLFKAMEWWGPHFSDVEWEDAQYQIPDWPSGGLVAPVLVPYFSTVQQTFELLWRTVTEVHPTITRREDLLSDPTHLRPYTDTAFKSTDHPVNTLRWEIIDFKGVDNAMPCEVRHVGSPHAAILAAACLHPEWVKAIDGGEVPNVWLSGYEVSLAGGERWSHVPVLELSGVGSQLRLSAHFASATEPGYANPIRRRLLED